MPGLFNNISHMYPQGRRKKKANERANANVRQFFFTICKTTVQKSFIVMYLRRRRLVHASYAQEAGKLKETATASASIDLSYLWQSIGLP